MVKKNKSVLVSILKGSIDITGKIIKTGYKGATSKTARKIYKGTAEFTKNTIKGTYNAVTSETAKKIYKKTGAAAVGLMRFTPPKKKLTKVQLIHYLTKEEGHIADTYNSLLKDYLNTDYNEKQYFKFRTHWRAICTQMVLGVIAQKFADDYIEMNSYLENELNKKDPEIMSLVNEFYHKAFATGGLDTPRILNSQCFNDKLSKDGINRLNYGLAFVYNFLAEFKLT